MNEATKLFIEEHIHDDVKKLALQYHKNKAINLSWALEQIKGWQIASYKLPLWAATKNIIYPPQLSLEQCSSQTTACYKASVLSAEAQRLQLKEPLSLVDLTGGMGVDFSFMAQQCTTAVYVEQQPLLCENALHNFGLLGLRQAKVVCSTAENYLSAFNRASFIFLDPARRDANGSKTVCISDCSPDVSVLKERLLAQCSVLMVKLSPMLDHHLALKTLNTPLSCVSSVHIVATQNECKELLFILHNAPNPALKIYCVNDNDVFCYTQDEASVPLLLMDEAIKNNPETLEGKFLYEPNVALMKAGCYALLSQKYKICALSANSHLFVSDIINTHWQGRKFEITQVCRFNKKEWKQKMNHLERANIAVRNFPLSVKELRKKLKLNEGGDFLFGTTLHQNTYVLLLCKKIT